MTDESASAHITYYYDIEQGSDAWYAARCGILTASEMKHIITPAKLQYASNDKERGHLYELVAQRITKYVEPTYFGEDMIRGMDDEIEAMAIYQKHNGPGKTVGFVTNNQWGYTIGYSPDLLVDGEGQVESKSRKQKFQIETILSDTMPIEHMIQVQTGMIVTARKWCDFVSYSGGLPMFTKRIYPDDVVQKAILAAAEMFEEKARDMLAKYATIIAVPGNRFIPTERRKEEEFAVGTYE